MQGRIACFQVIHALLDMLYLLLRDHVITNNFVLVCVYFRKVKGDINRAAIMQQFSTHCM